MSVQGKDLDSILSLSQSLPMSFPYGKPESTQYDLSPLSSSSQSVSKSLPCRNIESTQYELRPLSSSSQSVSKSYSSTTAESTDCDLRPLSSKSLPCRNTESIQYELRPLSASSQSVSNSLPCRNTESTQYDLRPLSSSSLPRSKSVPCRKAESTECKLRQKVSFDKIYIRNYERSIADHPAVSSGPGLSISWKYEPEASPLSVNDFELSRSGSRRTHHSQLLMPRRERERILRQECGYAGQDLASCVRSVNAAKFRRQQTINSLPLEPYVEAWQKFKGSVRRGFGRLLCKPSNETIVNSRWKESLKNPSQNGMDGSSSSLRSSLRKNSMYIDNVTLSTSKKGSEPNGDLKPSVRPRYITANESEDDDLKSTECESTVSLPSDEIDITY